MNKNLKFLLKNILVICLIVSGGFILFYGGISIRYIYSGQNQIKENTEFVSTGLRKFKENINSFTSFAEFINNDKYNCIFDAKYTLEKDCYNGRDSQELIIKMEALEVILVKKKKDYILVYTKYDLNGTFYLYDKNKIDTKNIKKYSFGQAHPIGKENEYWLWMKK